MYLSDDDTRRRVTKNIRDLPCDQRGSISWGWSETLCFIIHNYSTHNSSSTKLTVRVCVFVFRTRRRRRSKESLSSRKKKTIRKGTICNALGAFHFVFILKFNSYVVLHCWKFFDLSYTFFLNLQGLNVSLWYGMLVPSWLWMNTLTLQW